jgi:hypothetical protein
MNPTSSSQAFDDTGRRSAWLGSYPTGLRQLQHLERDVLGVEDAYLEAGLPVDDRLIRRPDHLEPNRERIVHRAVNRRRRGNDLSMTRPCIEASCGSQALRLAQRRALPSGRESHTC